ncbi:glycosyltransferase family 39 protein, partial [Patescibacteria group bacterium]|nr:glycosyltransferase family 39 protein [Patescibacteria group bacterium]
PPEGMAYEWSHPPLAKLGMVVGIRLFGQEALGWRFFGALLGIGCVLLVYLLGKEIFNRKVGILAAFLFAFDGLPLVMSRIGMNDTYFLFFGLLALWLFLKNKYFFSGFSFGLSLASKWTAVYWFLVFGFYWFFQLLKEDKKRYFSFLRKKFLLFLGFFLILPLGVYLLSYLPFFLSHHTFSQWWELQRQMWWYHTGLKATHPFTSPWWSWLIMKRPVWLFVEYGQEKIANIYAMGNPLVWWGGLISLPWVIWLAIKNRSEKLGLVIFAYLALFLPWAFSPRIMFIYHYLPAIPFLCLFLAWFLLWLARKKEFKPIFITYLLLVVVVFLFFYPHYIGINVSKWWNELYYWLPSWR